MAGYTTYVFYGNISYHDMFAAKIKSGQLALKAVEERHSLDQEQKSNIIVLKNIPFY